MLESVPVLAVILVVVVVIMVLALRGEPKAPKPPKQWDQPISPPQMPLDGMTGRAPAPAPTSARPPATTGGRTDPIRITHPLVRRAAEKALANPGDAPKYIMREGDDYYLVLDGIEDPEERRRAHEILSQFQDGEEGAGGDLPEFLRLIRRLTGM